MAPYDRQESRARSVTALAMLRNVSADGTSPKPRCYSLGIERDTRPYPHLKPCPPPRIFPSSGSALTVSGPTTSAAQTNGLQNQKPNQPFRRCSAMKSFHLTGKLFLRPISAITIWRADGADSCSKSRNLCGEKKWKSTSSRYLPVRSPDSRQSTRWIVHKMLAKNSRRQKMESHQAGNQKSINCIAKKRIAINVIRCSSGGRSNSFPVAT